MWGLTSTPPSLAWCLVFGVSDRHHHHPSARAHTSFRAADGFRRRAAAAAAAVPVCHVVAQAAAFAAVVVVIQRPRGPPPPRVVNVPAVFGGVPGRLAAADATVAGAAGRHHHRPGCGRRVHEPACPAAPCRQTVGGRPHRGSVRRPRSCGRRESAVGRGRAARQRRPRRASVGGFVPHVGVASRAAVVESPDEGTGVPAVTGARGVPVPAGFQQPRLFFDFSGASVARRPCALHFFCGDADGAVTFPVFGAW